MRFSLLLILTLSFSAAFGQKYAMPKLPTPDFRQPSGYLYLGPMESTEYLPPLFAHITVHRGGSKSEGFGKIVIRQKFTTISGAFHSGSTKPSASSPEYSYVELGGARFFPEDTDSIRVWDLKGTPDSGAWIFHLAKGRINAYAYFPGKYAQFFSLESEAVKALGNPESLLDPDSLKSHMKHFPRGFVELEYDPLKSVLIFNAAGKAELGAKMVAVSIYYSLMRQDHGISLARLDDTLAAHPLDYLTRLHRARALCKEGRFTEAKKDLDAAREMDSHYYGLDLAEAFCEEAGKRPIQALEKYRRTLHFGPVDFKMQAALTKKKTRLDSQSQGP